MEIQLDAVQVFTALGFISWVRMLEELNPFFVDD